MQLKVSMNIAMISFASQWFTGLVVAVVLLAVLYCFLKQLAENADAAEQEPIRRRQDETEPILPRKEVFFSYGAIEEHQPECNASCPAEDLVSEKMCNICYGAPRSCFLIPCGHCFTCFTCARRIVEEESKACPICRRLIHRVRRLESP